jgi:hypothetical protein
MARFPAAPAALAAARAFFSAGFPDLPVPGLCVRFPPDARGRKRPKIRASGAGATKPPGGTADFPRNHRSASDPAQLDYKPEIEGFHPAAILGRVVLQLPR